MNNRSRLLLFVLVGLTVLALAEQLTPISFCFSRLNSTTHTEDNGQARTGDLMSTVRVEKPLTRWLPFVKFGETVYLHTYQRATGSRSVLERAATTHVYLLVIGLCSTAKYDQLARVPFDKIHEQYLKR